MYKDCLQQRLIELSLIKELGEDGPNPKWYNENVYYLYHQLKGHSNNGCIELRNNMQ